MECTLAPHTAVNYTSEFGAQIILARMSKCDSLLHINKRTYKRYVDHISGHVTGTTHQCQSEEDNCKNEKHALQKRAKVFLTSVCV